MIVGHIGKVTVLSSIAMSVFMLGSILFANETSFSAPSQTQTAFASSPETPPVPLKLSTDTWGVFNPETGEMIAGDNVTVPHPIASVSKLFTAMVTLASSRKDEQFTITDSDVAVEGRSGKLTAGMKVTPNELLFPMLIESSNDAAEAIKRNLDAEFTEGISRYIHSLALNQTSIHDASGLSPANVSTVSNLATFFTYVRKTYPHILDITQLRTYIDARTGYINNDVARTFDTFMGGKQGFTDEAQHTFVGTFTIPHTHTEIGIVLLRSDDLHGDIAALIAYGESVSTTSDILSP
jgi:D-alanyl-D-alanine carboxypeptidase